MKKTNKKNSTNRIINRSDQNSNSRSSSISNISDKNVTLTAIAATAIEAEAAASPETAAVAADTSTAAASCQALFKAADLRKNWRSLYCSQLDLLLFSERPSFFIGSGQTRTVILMFG